MLLSSEEHLAISTLNNLIAQARINLSREKRGQHE